MGSGVSVPAKATHLDVYGAKNKDLVSHGTFRNHNLRNNLLAAWPADDSSGDFDVIVEGVSYRCHKDILKETSGYFQSVFRSGIRESLESRLELKLVSREVIEVIFRALYTGVFDVTHDNVQHVWLTALFLQIHDLCDECEQFVVRNVRYHNCIEMFYFGKSMLSTKVQTCAYSFMLFGFEIIVETEDFIHLMTPDVLSELLENQLLNVTNEDVVIKSVIKWTYYQNALDELEESHIEGLQTSQESAGCLCTESHLTALDVHTGQFLNERLTHLPQLFRSARMSLVSEKCLNDLTQNNFSSQSSECLEIIREAKEFLSKCDANYCSWQKSSTHRESSLFEHAVVIMTEHQLTVYGMEYPQNPCKVPWIPHLYGTTYQNLVVFKNKIYIEEVSKFYHSLLSLDDNNSCTWRHVIVEEIPEDSDLRPDQSNKLFCHLRSMYRFQHGVLCRFCEASDDTSDAIWEEVFRSESISAASEIVSFESVILFFVNTEEDVKVYTLDTETIVFKQLSRFDGRVSSLISISDGTSTFILNSFGDLQRLVKNDDRLMFQSVARLWDCEWKPMLAVTYLDKLVIFGTDLVAPLDVNTVRRSLPDFYDGIELVKLDEPLHCCPMTVPRRWFHQQ